MPGYIRQPCAVIADAVNILSNAWQDSHSSWDVSSRDAANTTVNTAILAGIVPSANNIYSGGAENFPRFLEDWGGKTLTYYGSMVELYKSRQSIGTWVAIMFTIHPCVSGFSTLIFSITPRPEVYSSTATSKADGFSPNR